MKTTGIPRPWLQKEVFISFGKPHREVEKDLAPDQKKRGYIESLFLLKGKRGKKTHSKGAVVRNSKKPPSGKKNQKPLTRNRRGASCTGGSTGWRYDCDRENLVFHCWGANGGQ